jgi:putative two-component system response regulator
MDQHKILVVDDHPDNFRLIQTYFRDEPWLIMSAVNGQEALQTVADDPPDLILLDLMMPRMDGFEVSRRLKNDPHTRLIPIVMITAFANSENKIKGIQIGVDDFITKPINFLELRTRVRSLLRIKSYTDDLEQAEKVIFSLALAVEAKDHYTMGHCKRLAEIGAELGRNVGMSDEDVTTIRRGAYLHDIGKIAVHDQILLKPGPLGDTEFQRVKQHPVVGERICKPLRTLQPALPIIRHHHERLDGSGYPDALKAPDIPVTAQIVGLVDCFDALTSERPYRNAVKTGEALNLIERDVLAGLWDKALFQDFSRIIQANAIEVK